MSSSPRLRSRPPVNCLAALFFLAPTVLPAAEFRGQLDPKVELGTRVFGPVTVAPAELVATLPAPPPTGVKVWVMKNPLTIKGAAYALALVAESSGAMTLWLDRDRDGKFAATERWPFPAGEASVDLTVPWDNGLYREFPLRVTREFAAGNLDQNRNPKDPTAVAALTYNFNFIAAGTVDIDGRPLRRRRGDQSAHGADWDGREFQRQDRDRARRDRESQRQTAGISRGRALSGTQVR
jgi:hypothetical protein